MPNKPFPTPLSDKLDQPKKRDYRFLIAIPIGLIAIVGSVAFVIGVIEIIKNIK